MTLMAPLDRGTVVYVWSRSRFGLVLDRFSHKDDDRYVILVGTDKLECEPQGWFMYNLWSFRIVNKAVRVSPRLDF